MPDAIDLLKIRRSVKPREMGDPGPSPAELETILTIGARVPDHGKLTPWRFIVFEGDGRLRAGEVISKSELTERLYEQDFDRDSNVVEVLVGRLRRKLDPDEVIKPIETLRGRGYRLSLPRRPG